MFLPISSNSDCHFTTQLLHDSHYRSANTCSRIWNILSNTTYKPDHPLYTLSIQHQTHNSNIPTPSFYLLRLNWTHSQNHSIRPQSLNHLIIFTSDPPIFFKQVTALAFTHFYKTYTTSSSMQLCLPITQINSFSPTPQLTPTKSHTNQNFIFRYYTINHPQIHHLQTCTNVINRPFTSFNSSILPLLKIVDLTYLQIPFLPFHPTHIITNQTYPLDLMPFQHNKYPIHIFPATYTCPLTHPPIRPSYLLSSATSAYPYLIDFPPQQSDHKNQNLPSSTSLNTHQLQQPHNKPLRRRSSAHPCSYHNYLQWLITNLTHSNLLQNPKPFNRSILILSILILSTKAIPALPTSQILCRQPPIRHITMNSSTVNPTHNQTMNAQQLPYLTSHWPPSLYTHPQKHQIPTPQHPPYHPQHNFDLITSCSPETHSAYL